MLDKLTRVSPPQTDSLSKYQRTDRLEDLGAKENKNDFSERLKSQLKKDQKKIDLKEKPKSIHAEQNESQPGEMKKRVAKKEDQDLEKEDQLEEKGDIKLSDYRTEKIDPTMISINMVSNESEVEIPENNENLATIEESNTQLSTQSFLPEQKIELIQPEQLQAESSFEFSQSDDATDVVELSAPQVQPDSTSEESYEGKSVLETASAPFQQKVMEVLKNDKTTFSQEKLEQIRDQLAAKLEKPADQISDQAINSKTEELMKHKSDDSGQQTFADAKSSREESSSQESTKFDNKHLGQTEFNSKFNLHPMMDSTKIDTARTSAGDLDPSVNELMNQASYLVTKGGGEVTLKMNSVDGMGEVHLKVMMDNGKMNIELNTQDKSVKKLIEDSLSDLRSSLAARQISLEHVKINSVNATSTENNSQSMQNNSNNSGSESNQSKTFAQLQQQMQQQSQQHQARQQNQNSFARNNFDLERPVVLPMVNVQKSIAKNYYGLNKGSSLNAVA